MHSKADKSQFNVPKTKKVGKTFLKIKTDMLSSTDKQSRESTAGLMTHVTCRLTAKNQDQLWNPTLGNRVRATFLPFTSTNYALKSMLMCVVLSTLLQSQTTQHTSGSILFECIISVWLEYVKC